MLLGIWHMGTLSGEHLKTVDMCLLCFIDRILIFLLPSFARKCSDLELSSYPDVWKRDKKSHISPHLFNS